MMNLAHYVYCFITDNYVDHTSPPAPEPELLHSDLLLELSHKMFTTQHLVSVKIGLTWSPLNQTVSFSL